MGSAAGNGLESRFEKYSEVMIKALSHASRDQAARWYLRGLMLPVLVRCRTCYWIIDDTGMRK